jgi:hypothetical protein
LYKGALYLYVKEKREKETEGIRRERIKEKTRSVKRENNNEQKYVYNKCKSTFPIQ